MNALKIVNRPQVVSDKFNLLMVSRTGRSLTTDNKLPNQELLHYINTNTIEGVLEFLEETIHFEDVSQLKGIVADYKMVKQDDYYLAKAIKRDARYRDIPFIVLIKDADTLTVKEKQHLVKLRIDDFISESTKSIDLYNKILQAKEDIDLGFKEYEEEEKAEMWPLEDFAELKIPVAKRAFDIAFASCAIVALSPLFLVLAAAIKLESKGNIFYVSNRIGKGYKRFGFIKFRSMFQDADKRLAEIEHLNQYKGEEDNAFKKFKNDPRITRIGRIIRKTSIDELPQLINVLKGDMSIVGNRPLPEYEAQAVVKDGWADRFLAPAGITGLWQVSKRGKNDMSTKERMELDVKYAKRYPNNYSFWYDMKLILRTFTAMVQEEDV